MAFHIDSLWYCWTLQAVGMMTQQPENLLGRGDVPVPVRASAEPADRVLALADATTLVQLKKTTASDGPDSRAESPAAGGGRSSAPASGWPRATQA